MNRFLAMKAFFTLLLLAGSVVGPVGVGALAQAVDPSAGLVLSPQKYRGVIGQPPAAGSTADIEDLAVLRWNQTTRYPESVLHTWRFLNRNVGSFDAAVGSDITKSAPILSSGLADFLKRIDAVKDVLKDEIARSRPFVRDPSLKPCLPLESTYSYPSGHATWYAAASLLLVDLLPERRERLLAVGQQGGFARSYCLLHYPSDVLASQRLAAAVSRDVIASPQWQAFRQQVTPELAKLLVVQPAGLPLLSN